MNKFLLIFSLIIVSPIYSQTINENNYYDYISNGKGLKGMSVTTNWLRENEVVKVLEEEMKKAGFKSVLTFKTVKISDSDYVTSICFSDKSKVGFLYEATHRGKVTLADRNLKSLNKAETGNDYVEYILNLNEQSKFVQFEVIPDNLFIVKENSYWYQYTGHEEDDKFLVTKEIITEILRKDIRKVLSNFKK